MDVWSFWALGNGHPFLKIISSFIIYIFFFNRPEEIKKIRKPQKENWGHWKERRKISIGNNRWFSPFSVDNSVYYHYNTVRNSTTENTTLLTPRTNQKWSYETLSLPVSHFFLSRAAGPFFFLLYYVYRPSSSINGQPCGILYFHVS